ncbi:MAG: HEAT repeat domain-containing protein [Planctomycetota bacterium]|nr:HEAT repeat domain-containing protein [Planctomycetota bacterium]
MATRLRQALPLLLLSLAVGAVWSAEPAPAEPRQDLTIALNEDQELLRQTDLFRRVVREDAGAKAEWNRLDANLRARALAQVLLYAKEDLRLKAAGELAELTGDDDPSRQALPALVRAALRDENEAVREAAWKQVAARHAGEAPKLLVPHLRAKDPEVRGRAVKALRALDAPRVYEAIVEHWRESWGAGPRAYMFVARQQAYVADYEISGDSYDPVVRTFLVGAVLDVKPLQAWADLYVIKFLREVSGQDAGNDLKAWRNWWAERKGKDAQPAAPGR